ncbi:MAG: stage II sporulation protein R [Oscillospiraceae bacterium]|nr:stage II sporulation protein R [Oscillospiraceae bacterium]
MRKSLKRLGICALIVCLVWAAGIVSNKQLLQNGLIRLHVVAASDSETDQNLKLLVRDAVIRSLRENMDHVKDMEEAKAYLRENLPKIEALANGVLQNAGIHDTVTVSLRPEEFGTRVYDTFTLPAGVYEALRITIGAGNGHNWWCVVFPALCVGATVEEFEETAHCAGLSDSLTAALAGEEDYEVRFLILDALGKLENFLHKG